MSTLGTRIFQLRTSKNLTQQQLMSRLNFDNLSKYEKDQREPKYSVLLAIADFFNVTVDWLLTGKSNPVDYTYSPNELRCLELYKQLSHSNQEKELARMETLIEVLKEDTVLYKSVPHIGYSAAGIPIAALELADYNEIETDKIKADFALTIKGQSMEPMINDDSIIFVHQTAQLENGEIGVFQINDTSFSTDEEVTCKIYKYLAPNHIQLLSINPDFAPIDINPAEQDFRILGKVIL